MVEGVVSKLAMWNAVDMDDRGLLTCTPLGVVAATLYYHPKDVHHWASCLAYIDQNDLGKTLCYCVFIPPTILGCHIPRKDEFRVLAAQQELLGFENIGSKFNFADLADP